MRLARGAMPGGQKTMEGRIEIAPIENPRHRRITYAKRKAGLVRKATELAVLCDADVAVLMCNADKRLSVYSSSPVDHVLEKFSLFEGIPRGWAFEASPPRPPPVCALIASSRPLSPSQVFTEEDYFRGRELPPVDPTTLALAPDSNPFVSSGPSATPQASPRLGKRLREAASLPRGDPRPSPYPTLDVGPSVDF